MNRLADKTFQIVLAADTSISVGAHQPANIPGSGTRVITGGELQNWYLIDGSLALDGVGPSVAKAGKVSVIGGIQEGTKWKILRLRDNVYRIKSPERNVAWTAGLESETEITLVAIGSVEAKYQEFEFVEQ